MSTTKKTVSIKTTPDSQPFTFELEESNEIIDLKGRLPLEVFDQINEDLELGQESGVALSNDRTAYYWEVLDDSD